MNTSERLQHVKDFPDQHKHDWLDLQACCTVDNIFDPRIMEAHPPLGRNGGRKCDVTEGPCSCGAWH